MRLVVAGCRPAPPNVEARCSTQSWTLRRLSLVPMDTTDAPQIIEHVHESLTFTPYDTKWIPLSARPVINFAAKTQNERNNPRPSSVFARRG